MNVLHNVLAFTLADAAKGGESKVLSVGKVRLPKTVPKVAGMRCCCTTAAAMPAAAEPLLCGDSTQICWSVCGPGKLPAHIAVGKLARC